MGIHKIILPVIAVLTVLLFAGCSFFFGTDAGSPGGEGTELREGVERADALGAIIAIYTSLEEYSIERLDEDAAEAILGIYPHEVAEIHAYYSSPKFTLADVIIIRPNAGERDEIRRKLLLFKESRIREFENYDILNAHRIARDAIIYDQGDYVILLMLKDTEAARAIVDGFIPQ
jgi:hypothetical protein